MIEKPFLNQGAVTVEVHTQLINDLNNNKREKSKRNHSSIHATLIISILNVTARNQIYPSYVDWRTTSLKIVQNGYSG